MIDVFDLQQFAPAFLKISDKSGDLVPFKFNRAQQYVHDRIEDQLKRLGYVRILILKGRQQGCCYAPNMRVLTSDYQWIKIKDLHVGQSLMCVDEESVGVTASGRKSERRIRTGKVEAKVYLKAEAFEILLENGAKLIATGEHRHLCLKRSGTDTQWREVKDCKAGDHIRAFCNSPDDLIPNFEDGWFAGLLDGEGSFGANPAIRIALSQVEGAVLTRAKKYLDDNNIKYYELIDKRTSGVKSKLGDKPVHCLRIDRITDVLKILTKTRPSRFVERLLFDGKKLPKNCSGFDSWKKIIHIKPVGKIDVVDLQTSHKTFVCEGLVSHNSTYIQARFFHRVLTTKGTQAFILTHMTDATKSLFEMTKRYNNNLPEGLAPKADKDNDNRLMFDKMGSGYRVGTAGSKEVGRSMTNQLMHLSEYAFYENVAQIKRGVEQTVADIKSTEKIKESTANGIANAFYIDWQDAKSGESDWETIFVPWYWQDEYTRDATGLTLTDDERDWMALYGDNGLTHRHLSWRRNKLADFDGDYDQKCKGFSQEYPFTDEEAFLHSITDTFITTEPVMRARKADVDSEVALIIGVDPARGGVDRSAIMRRRGRKAFGGETHQGLTTMELVGKIKSIIERERPHKVFIDCIGIGAGVVDRLQEMGFDCVEGINVARSANNKDQFANLRAELWHEMRDWFLQDLPVQIPNDPDLQKEICGLGYKYNSSGRLLIESKDEAKKRGMRSPDKADSLMLTFSYGQHAGTNSYKPRTMPPQSSGMFT